MHKEVLHSAFPNVNILHNWSTISTAGSKMSVQTTKLIRILPVIHAHICACV